VKQLILAASTALVVISGTPVFGQIENSGLVESGAEVYRIGGEFAFLEGPAADRAGNLYFTDIENNRIHLLSTDGTLSVVREPSYFANGLTMDLDGNLLICEQAAQRITSMDSDGNITVVADAYNGRPLNSPNDAWVNLQGGIYFTDPRYGHPDGEISQDGEHVYYISPDRSALRRVITTLPKPNGVIGTEDGRRLYVADTQLRKVFQFDVAEDGSVSNQQEFADQGSDGMTMDALGNVYLTWVGGVYIYNSQGERIEFIETPQMPANVGFGGADGQTLFMTARTGLYALRMNVKASR